MIDAPKPFPGAGILPKKIADALESGGEGPSRTQDASALLHCRLRWARIKAAFGSEPNREFSSDRQIVLALIRARGDRGDPVSAALAQKGWGFRAKARWLVNTKHTLIARRRPPLDRARIARRRTSGALPRRALFRIEDLSAPLAALAPNLAGAAVVFLVLSIIL